MQPLIDVTTAERMIAGKLPAFDSERIPIIEASGRILRQRVRAERDQPPFDRVMMDGIAIRWSTALPEVFVRVGAQMAGAQLKGTPQKLMQRPDACMDVTTGAVLPEGYDCVIPVEETQPAGAGYKLVGTAPPVQWQFVHRRGADCAAGSLVLEPGVRIEAPQMATLAANGIAEVEVARIPGIAIIATGDELAAVDASLLPGQIRRSNDLALMSALASCGFRGVSLHHVTDDEQALRSRLAELLDRNAVLVLSGGVSMGLRDYVPSCLESLGVRAVFHGIAQRPGKPMWFGMGPHGQAVFALPGNPVSSLVCMIRYVRPALLAAMGLRKRPVEWTRLAADPGPPSKLTAFLPVSLEPDSSGGTRAHPVASRNSGDFTSLAGTDGIIELPPAAAAGSSAAEEPRRPAGPGTPVAVYRW